MHVAIPDDKTTVDFTCNMSDKTFGAHLLVN